MTRYTIQWRWAEKGSGTSGAWGEGDDGDHAYKPVPTLDAARELLQRDIMGSVEANVEDVDPDGLIVKMLLAQASVAEVGQIITLPVPNYRDDLQHRIVEISPGKTPNQKETDT